MLEALKLESGSLHTLAAFPDLFLQPRHNWPTGDIAVAPEDITVRRRPNAIDVIATVRNFGGADLHNAHVSIIAATGGRGQTPTGRRSFVVNVPGGGSAEVTASFPMPAGYGTVLVPRGTAHQPCALRHVDGRSHTGRLRRLPNREPAGRASRLRRLATRPVRFRLPRFLTRSGSRRHRPARTG